MVSDTYCISSCSFSDPKIAQRERERDFLRLGMTAKARAMPSSSASALFFFLSFGPSGSSDNYISLQDGPSGCTLCFADIELRVALEYQEALQ